MLTKSPAELAISQSRRKQQLQVVVVIVQDSVSSVVAEAASSALSAVRHLILHIVAILDRTLLQLQSAAARVGTPCRCGICVFSTWIAPFH